MKCASQDRHQEQPVTSDQPQRKRKRRVRVKKVREDLKQQMEFYFCDANLRFRMHMITDIKSLCENRNYHHMQMSERK